MHVLLFYHSQDKNMKTLSLHTIQKLRPRAGLTTVGPYNSNIQKVPM